MKPCSTLLQVWKDRPNQAINVLEDVEKKEVLLQSLSMQRLGNVVNASTNKLRTQWGWTYPEICYSS